jgi:soluble cytochrome b562
MKISRTIVLMLLVGFLTLLVANVAHADGPVTPPPPPVTTPIPPVPPVEPLAGAKAIDAAYADAAKYQAAANSLLDGMQATLNQANAALSSANSSLYSAQASIGQYQASVAQYKILLQQSEAARVAAQQGQIQQAVDLANAAQESGAQVLSLASESSRSAMQSAQQANQAVQDVLKMRTQLSSANQANESLSKTNAAQAYRLAQLEPYALDTYQHAMAAWVLSAVLGLVLIAVLLMLVIVFAVERRNRWPRLKQNLDGAVVFPITKQL